MKEWFKSQKYRDYLNKKRHGDPGLRLHRSISTAINTALKEGKKGKKVFTILNYSLEELEQHLRKNIPVGYDFDDYGKSLHLDHIIPKDIYDAESEEYISKCWNVRNLRLIPSVENIKKKNKVDMNLIEKYQIKDLLPNSLGG